MVTYTPGTTNLLEAVSTDTTNATGGDDIINAGEGNNLIIGGVGADTVTAGSGADIVIGDNGRITWTAGGVISNVATSDIALGGNDDIRVGDGNNIVAGGFGADVIQTGVGEDLILGDNGEFTYTTGAGGVAVLTGARTTDTNGTTGGNDVIVAGGSRTPVFIDLDGDGDLDAVLGNKDGTLSYFENTGTAAVPVYVERTGAANPLGGIDVGSNSVPAFTDIDSDGDLDLVVGNSNGTLKVYENTGTAGAPVYVERTGAANPLDGIDVGNNSAPAFTDLDGDGDADLVVGESGGTLKYYENTGTVGAPVYVERTGAANPMGGIDVGNDSAPAFADANGDGILDLLVGESGGTVKVYENTGTAGAPVYAANTTLTSPYAGLDVGGASSRNIVLAGVGDDRVNQPARPGTNDPAGVVSGGPDIVMGDNGYVNWDVNGLLAGFGSSQPDVGGNDLIDVGDGANIVVGGFGNDTINAGAGADILLGDNGMVTYTPGTTNLLEVVATDTTNATGGDDIINAGEGNNLIIGGVGTDTVTGGNGANLVIGDNGRITWTPGGNLVSVASTDPALGAGDTIVLGNGGNVVIGGFGGDTVTSGSGNDTLIGDNGAIGYTGGVMTSVASTDVIAGTGGNDIINGGDGNNLVIGGVGGDAITTGSGADVIIGDNGTILLDGNGTVVRISTGNPILGGDDIIATGAGNDIAIGGAGSDTITSPSGNNILIGDGGLVTIIGGTTTIGTLDPQYGGDDIISGGSGNNVIIGGAGFNVIVGSTGSDVIIGNNGQVIIIDGIVRSTGIGGGLVLVLDADDLLLAGLFDGLPGSLAEIEDALAALSTRFDPLLDVAVFRRIFGLGGGASRLALVGGELFRELFGSDAITVPETPSHSEILGATGATDSLDSTGEALLAAVVGEAQTLSAVDEISTGATGASAGDLLAAAFGAAGLVAASPAASRRTGASRRRQLARWAGRQWRRLRGRQTTFLRR